MSRRTPSRRIPAQNIPPAPAALSVPDAQNRLIEIAAELEKQAFGLHTLARDLQVPDRDEDFPFEKPGPDHLAWYVAGAAGAAHDEICEILERLRGRARLTFEDLLADWQRQDAAGGQQAARS